MFTLPPLSTNVAAAASAACSRVFVLLACRRVARARMHANALITTTRRLLQPASDSCSDGVYAKLRQYSGCLSGVHRRDKKRLASQCWHIGTCCGAPHASARPRLHLAIQGLRIKLYRRERYDYNGILVVKVIWHVNGLIDSSSSELFEMMFH